MFRFWEYFKGRINRLVIDGMWNERERVNLKLIIFLTVRVIGRMEFFEDRKIVGGVVWGEE